MVTFIINEDLRFIFQAAKSGGVNNPVTVTLKRIAMRARRLVINAPPRIFGNARIFRQRQGTIIIGSLRTHIARIYS